MMFSRAKYLNLILVFYILFIGIEKSCSQSLNITYGYPYYFLKNNNSYGSANKLTERFNFILELSAIKYFNSSCVEVGYYYSTKNFEIEYNSPYSNIVTSEISIDYHTIPISLSRRLFSHKSKYISVLVGFKFIKPFKYQEIGSYDDGTKQENENIEVSMELASAVSGGLSYKQRINNFLLVTAKAILDYKLSSEFETVSHGSITPEDNLNLSFSIGIEGLLSKNIKYFAKSPEPEKKIGFDTVLTSFL